MKKAVSLFLALLMICLTCPVVFAEDAGITAFSVNPYGGEEDAIDTISWFVSGGNRFLFLPADTDLTAAKLYFTADGDVTLDGDALVSGGTAAPLTAGTHTLLCGGKSYTLNVMFSANLPAVYITTQSGSLSYIHANKENKEPGKIRVYEDGVKTLDKDLKQIKGRGNATWGYPKKPYNIKFDKKTDLFGMGKAKKWTLLANYRDLPLIHNAYGWEFAKAFGMTYTSEYTYVDLYINGDYMGNYVICESVEIGENRVDIADLEKANENANPDLDDFDSLPRGGTGANNTVQPYGSKGSRKWVEIPNDPADVTGGYLMEYEYGGRYNPEISGFVTKNGQPVVIKSPEQASRAEVTYIADFMDAGTEALYSETGYNAEGRHYSEYFDVDSLAAAYLTQEISMNYDAALSSFFAYKPEGEDSKVVFGPVWDMDNAFGSRQTNMNVPLITTNLWWANQLAYHGIPTVLAAANRHADFRALVREKWAQCLSSGAFLTVNNKIAALAATLKESAAMNGVRWNLFSTADGAVAAAKWEQNRDISMGFVRDRTAELSKGLGANGAYLYYDVNGANSGSWATVSVISEIGDSVTVRNITGNGTVNPPSGKKFYCWNTAADGSGTAYFPGDTLILAGECTVLYAVWKTQAEIDAIAAAAQLAADRAAAAAVQSKIAEIGEVAYTEASKAMIDAARAAYNALTDAQKALVENYGTLTAAETRYAALAADRAAANAVQGKIAEIGEVTYTEASKAKIDAARAAYNALTDAQKALVENYGTLTAAETRYAELKTAAETPTEPATEPSGGGRTSLWDFFMRIINWFRSIFRAFADWFRN